MNEQQESLHTLKTIRSIMERSGRFISLSGWSGVAAGICALVGAFVARQYINAGTYSAANLPVYVRSITDGNAEVRPTSIIAWLANDRLVQIAAVTFVAACITAFFFTYIKTKRQGLKIWDSTSTRLMINMLIPLVAGGLLIFRMIELGFYGLIAPASLIFYGLALLNASKYTLKEIRWLALTELVLGIVSCWNIGNGLYYWALGFGVLHIIYGVIMWWKYERGNSEDLSAV